jgi:two-component system nitrate/nitrite response regulator NarL
LNVLPDAHTGTDALAAVTRDRPELVLVDLGLPDVDGLVLGERILAELPATKIVAVTALHDTHAVGEAIRLGFSGYVTKDVPLSQFVQAIESVIDGQVVVAHQAPPSERPADPAAEFLLRQLTRRERDVLRLLGEGAGGPDIARRLSVSQNTVRTHVQNILTKLQVHTRLEAVAFAARHGELHRRDESLF